MALAILVAIFLTVALGREFMLVKLSGWQRLSRKYRCRAPFPGKCRACWWAQFIKPGPKREIVVSVGRLTRWPFRLEFPPYWIGADSGGLYVKRNVWNLLHPALLIPWESIENAVELTYKDLVRKTATASDVARRPKELLPAMAAAQGIDEPLLGAKDI